MVRRAISISRTALVAALLGGCTFLPAQAAFAVHHNVNKQTEREAVEALEEQWRQAQISGDVATMDRLLSEDFVGITAFGQVTTKAQQLARVRDHVIVLKQLDLSDVKVKLIGNHVAVVTSRAEVSGVSDGRPIGGTFRYTRVYQRLPSGVWKITSFEATRARPDGLPETGSTSSHP